MLNLRPCWTSPTSETVDVRLTHGPSYCFRGLTWPVIGWPALQNIPPPPTPTHPHPLHPHTTPPQPPLTHTRLCLHSTSHTPPILLVIDITSPPPFLCRVYTAVSTVPLDKHHSFTFYPVSVQTLPLDRHHSSSFFSLYSLYLWIDITPPPSSLCTNSTSG